MYLLSGLFSVNWMDMFFSEAQMENFDSATARGATPSRNKIWQSHKHCYRINKIQYSVELLAIRIFLGEQKMI